MAINNTSHNIEVPFGPSAPWGHPAWHPPAWAVDESTGVSANVSSELNRAGTLEPDNLLDRGAKPLDLNAVNEALIEFQKMSVSNSNMFPAFLDNSPGPTRQSPSPMAQHQVNNAQVNGAGMNCMNGMNVALPMNAGHQMDLNVLFNQVEELSQLLRENREKTQAIIASAEELAVSFVPCYYCPTQSPVHFDLEFYFRGTVLTARSRPAPPSPGPIPP